MKHLLVSIVSVSLFFVSCHKEKNTLKDVNQAMVNDSLEMYKKLYDEAAYFSIDKNENAQKTFAPEKIDGVMAKVVQDFSALNQQEGGNPLIPKDANGSETKLNKMSVINHKWLIVDFYNETTTGELLIKYEYAPNQTTQFKVIDMVLY